MMMMMVPLTVPCVFVLLGLVSSAAALPLEIHDEQGSSPAALRRPRTLEQDLDEVLRSWSVSGLDRRRQLGDIEFSNRYSEFLRSKAKQTSMCAFLRRMQGVKKSGVSADTERVNLLLQQNMCPSVLPWSSDL
ncbi:unnamed protein product [Knipowitschia caucasica]|uniref:Uncharacterized protein n=1 Tax=Knipowitschia caucasica TaxID=637954 RepID=A0AAV2KPH1_KNICA